MGSGSNGNYIRTAGSTSYNSKIKLFAEKGSITVQSISVHREKFLGKNAKQIAKLLHKHGYETIIRKSIHSHSSAKIVVNIKQSKDLNISQIQVSPGNKRHGNIPYIKISTTNIGKIKIIDGTPNQYKNDGKETAIVLFRRHKS